MNPQWFSCLKVRQIPRDPKIGEVETCGDTMFADMTTAWGDLPQEEREFFLGLKCVFGWKVLPDIWR